MLFDGLERLKSLFPGFQIQKNRAAQPGESSAATVRTILPWLRPLCPSSKASVALSKGITALRLWVAPLSRINQGSDYGKLARDPA